MEISQYAHFDFNDKDGNPLWPKIKNQLQQAAVEVSAEDFPSLAALVKKIAQETKKHSVGAAAFLHVLADLIDFQIDFQLSDSGHMGSKSVH